MWITKHCPYCRNDSYTQNPRMFLWTCPYCQKKVEEVASQENKSPDKKEVEKPQSHESDMSNK